MAPTNKCLAQSNKSRTRRNATMKRYEPGSALATTSSRLVREFAFQLRRADRCALGHAMRPRRGRYHSPAILQGSCMRIKFEAVDKNGKPHKRASVRRLYSNCVVMHFAAHPPGKLWSDGGVDLCRA